MSRMEIEVRYLELRRKYGSRKLGRAWIPSTPLAVKIEIEQLLRVLNRSLAA